MTHQHANLEDTVYFWFGSNDTSGSGDDGASALADVREAGAAAGAIPVLSPSPTLLTHANYPAGCYEVAVPATAANGFTGTYTYGVFCTLTVDSQNPTGFIGSFTLDPIIANVKEISDDAPAADNMESDYDGTGYNKSNSTIGTTTTNTDMVGTDSAALASVATEARLAELDAGNLPTDIANLNDLSAAQVNAEVDTALADINLDHLAGTSVAIPSIPTGTYVDQMMNDGAATFDRTTDSLQAIRDRGDTAWITGGGGGITDILNVTPLIPKSIDLANTATWRLALMLTNALDDLPSTAEITPGTISIDRKAIGGTSWSAVVTDAACSEINGLIYYDEVFDTGTGYAEGDSIRVTFKSQKITVAANDYEIIGATGRIFYTLIRETERGTDSAALASVATEARLAELDAGNLPTDIAAIPTATENADALLKRDWNSVTGEAARSLLNAARFLRNKWSISGPTLTVTEEDDSTPAWTATITDDATADPVTGVDPT